MYIKEVTIKGFKSYANKIVINTFQQGLNIIVGRNGSGKSNLLLALQMILADEEAKKKSRQSILSAVLPSSAHPGEAGYVEVIFDNRDGFFPEDSADVSLKRCIGGKRDKFFINGKQVEQFDKYLAQVGLMTPYSFVQQGRMNQLATMNDRNRFELMRVVCGESAWTTILGQISKVRHDSEMLFVEITDLVQRLVTLKPVLKEQTKELAKYTKENDSKRAAEYVYYSRDLERIQEELGALIESKNVFVQELSKCKKKSDEYDSKVEKINSRASRIKREEKIILAEIDSHQTKLQKLALEIGKLENLQKDYAASDQGAETSTSTQRSNLNSVQAKFDKALANYQNYEKMVDEFAQKCSAGENQITLLTELLTETTGGRFATEDQRKKYVQVKLGQLQELETKSENSLGETLSLIDQINKMIIDKKKDLDKLSEEKQARIDSIGQVIIKISQLDTEKHQHESEKQAELNILASLEEKILATAEQLDQLHSKMNRPFGASIMGSYLAMKKVMNSLMQLEDFGSIEAGYFGTVLENINCEQGFESAVHVAAGSKLFYHIVANNQVALKLLGEFNRMKFKNEVRFIVMSRLMNENVTYPEDNQIRPLMEHLEFDENVKSAMDFVFSKVLCCASSEVATRYAKNYRFTCVTLDGDKVSSSGVMSGGYRDSSFNIITLETERRALTSKKDKFEDELHELKKSVGKHNSILLGIAKSLEKCDTQKAFENGEIQKILNAKNARREELRNLERSHEIEVLKLEQRKIAQVTASDNIKYFKLITDSKSSPISTEKFKKLKTELKSNLEQLKDGRKRLATAKKARAVLENQLEKAKLAGHLEESNITDGSFLPSVRDLLREQTEQKITLLTGSVSNLEDQILEYQNLLDQIKNEANTIAQKSERFNEAGNVLKEKVAGTQLEINQLQERYFEEENKYFKTKEFLRNIGSYPSGAADYSSESPSRLFKIVKNANRILNGMSSINHRAREQYDDVKSLINKFRDQGKYFGAVDTRITQMLDEIEKNKGGICIDIVRAVQESFRKIFQELVLKASGTRGYGRFVLHGDSIEFTETNRLQDGKKWWEDQEFVGASLKVSFKDWGDEPMQLVDILQLSGGQKSIVALSFLLAIQHANPQSLYVFDEVDQALDPTYREAVAQKMKELSNSAQFLCTTFRKEFVEYADSFLGISYRNQKSQVRPVTREEALDFVQPDNSDLSGPSLDESLMTSSGTDQGQSGSGFNSNIRNG